MKMVFNKNIYLLIGGGCHLGASKNRIANEIEYWLKFKNIKTAKILFIPFAKDKNDWEKTVQKFTKSIFAKLLKNVKLSISTASLKIDNLKVQLSEADIIFFTGGNEKKIINKFKNLIPTRDKIIIGSSAGANFLSTLFYSNDRKKIESGLQILPIKTICHFSSEKIDRAIALSLKGSHPLFPIRENEYLTLIY